MVSREALAGCDFTSCPRPPNLDWWLWRQVCCGRPVFVVREKLTRWRMHDSYMTQESVESLLRQREFIDQMDRLLLARHPLRRRWGLVRRRRSLRAAAGVLRGDGDVQPRILHLQGD